MKTSSITRMVSCSLLFSLIFFSCQKEQNTPPSSQEQEELAIASAESDAESEAIFNDVFDNVMGVNSEVAVGGTGIFNGPSRGSGIEVVGGAAQIDSIHCYVITITHLNSAAIFPIRIELDFGAGCVGRDGRTRKGRIITEYSNRLTIAGATATTIFDGYSVNDIKVEGKHVLSNKSTIGRPSLNVKVTAKLTSLSGNFSEWNCDRTIAQIDGQLTTLAFDDIFTITGSASGSVKKADKFFQWSTTISKPLVKKFSCRWITQGTIIIKKGSTHIAILEYGNGQCDDKASFTVIGHVREITLH